MRSSQRLRLLMLLHKKLPNLYSLGILGIARQHMIHRKKFLEPIGKNKSVSMIETWKGE